MIARRVLRPVGALAVTTGLALGVVSALAQEDGATGGRIDPAGAPVDLHEGICADPVLDPWATIGRLERQDYGEIDDAELDEAAIGEDDGGDLAAGVEDDEAVLGEGEDDGGVLDGGPITETGREGEPVEDAAEAAAAVGEEISDELAEADAVAIEEPASALIEDELEGDVALDEEEEDPAAATGPAVRPIAPAFYVAEGEVDAGFEPLFDQRNVIAVHRSAGEYDEIVACGGLGGVAYEGEEEVVVGMAPVDGSGIRGYAVFESDPALFGEDVTAVTVHIFENLPTQRDRAAATPAS